MYVGIYVIPGLYFPHKIVEKGRVTERGSFSFMKCYFPHFKNAFELI